MHFEQMKLKLTTMLSFMQKQMIKMRFLKRLSEQAEVTAERMESGTKLAETSY